MGGKQYVGSYGMVRYSSGGCYDGAQGVIVQVWDRELADPISLQIHHLRAVVIKLLEIAQ